MLTVIFEEHPGKSNRLNERLSPVTPSGMKMQCINFL